MPDWVERLLDVEKNSNSVTRPIDFVGDTLDKSVSAGVLKIRKKIFGHNELLHLLKDSFLSDLAERGEKNK